MRVYYAHCIALYGTPQEARDLQTLRFMFPDAEIINPASEEIERQCQEVKTAARIRRDAGLNVDPSAEVMNRIFKPLAQSCSILVFRALPDGRVPVGVATEIEWAREASVPILELPSALHSRKMTLEETREYLAEVGQR